MSSPRSLQIGESFVGEGPHAAHLNTVLGAKGTPFESAWVTALATPRAGHVPFMVCLAPNVAAKPATVFVNKAPIENDTHAALTWGAAQAGVAGGIADAVSAGIVAEGEIDELLLIAAVWVNPAADDADAVYRHNRTATYEALVAGQRHQPSLQEVQAVAVAPHNAYYRAQDPL